MTIAIVSVPVDTDIPALVAAAGGTMETAWYEDGNLHVSGVEQAALDAAWGSYSAGSLAHAKAARISALAALRYAQETAGITFNGIHIDTDDRSRSLIDEAERGLRDGFLPSIEFKVRSNGSFTLDVTGMTALRRAVYLHNQACRSNEVGIANQIAAAADHAALDAIDITVGWPS